MSKKARTVMVGVLAAGLLFGCAVLGAVVWVIDQSVRENCAMAQQAHPHPGDDVAALVVFMNSDSHPLRGRNHAVWTLGRLRDPKALPALEAAYTGEPCNHDRDLCQYELEKAIKRCGGIPQPPRKTRR